MLLKRENSAIKLQAVARGKQARKATAARRATVIADEILGTNNSHHTNIDKFKHTRNG